MTRVLNCRCRRRGCACRLFLKSVSYQPAPLSRNPAADTFLNSSGCSQAGQSVRGASDIFWIFFQLVATGLALIFVNRHDWIPGSNQHRFGYSGGQAGDFREPRPVILPENSLPARPEPIMPANSQPLSELIADLDFASGEPLADSNQGEVRRFSLNGRELAIKQPKGRGLAWTIRAATLRHEFSCLSTPGRSVGLSKVSRTVRRQASGPGFSLTELRFAGPNLKKP